MSTHEAIKVARDKGRIVSVECSSCGMKLKAVGEWHPMVYCLLWQKGVDDPEKHLAALGYVREARV